MVRCYVPSLPGPGELVSLPDEEGQHVVRVLRLKAGDPVRVFDGHGHEFDAVIEQAGKPGATVRIGAARTPAPEARVAVTLVQAVLKGDKMDDVVRDAVMMGVASIQPILTVRTEVTAVALERGRRVERWHRVAVASAKQCGRAVVPVIHPPCSLAEALAAVAGRRLPAPALMFVEPGASADASTLSEVAPTLGAAPADATIVIGPEGGWTPDEIAQGAAAGRLLTLGARTLRADAMAIVALAALFATWREF